jgi:hypothetical protein
VLPARRNLAAGEEGRAKWELADIFRQYGETYRRTHPLPRSHLKVMRFIEICRTAELGGHLEKCDRCGFEHPAYNSCRNRHCPKCQSLAKARWLEKQSSEVLPVGYFHVIFTLPHEFNPLILTNNKILLNILFKKVRGTLLEFGRTHLGGTLGVIAVLHTWDQKLNDHFHLHCLIPAGALAFDQSHWISARKTFLFHYKALSRHFRRKFLDGLEQAFSQGKLCFPGQAASLKDPKAFSQMIQRLRRKDWVVYTKKPFSSPEKVLDYLGRYTHRVALSNNRILSVHNGQVTFSYRDRKDKDRLESIPLDAQEFIRRFMLHVLPQGFMRIRHFGFLANRSKGKTLTRCRELLGLDGAVPTPPEKSTADLMQELTETDIRRCPVCGKGTLVFAGQIPPSRLDSS